MTGGSADIQAQIAAYLRSCDAAMADVPVLQPADPFLDTAGEELRSRIFLTSDETGESLCLRPEFTIPVCRDHIASRADTPRRYAYLGEVFRQRREAGNEFLQAGIEDLGETDTATADARSLADAAGLLQAVLPKVSLSVTLGDQAVFEAVLAGLGLPRGWQKRLARAFGSPQQLETALAALAGPQQPSSLPAGVAEMVERGDLDAVANHVSACMSEAGLAPHAGRTAVEIATRLIEKTELENIRLKDEHLAALRRFLAIHEPLAGAASVLEKFAADTGIALDGAISRFGARAEAVAAAEVKGAEISYDAAFGRPLDYYTGLVFEIRSKSSGETLVGGGRYDRLLTLLGARAPIPGVGFSVWLDRIVAERGEGA